MKGTQLAYGRMTCDLTAADYDATSQGNWQSALAAASTFSIGPLFLGFRRQVHQKSSGPETR